VGEKDERGEKKITGKLGEIVWNYQAMTERGSEEGARESGKKEVD
jgi:hypothetical protein